MTASVYLASLYSGSLVERLGWVLVHSIWQLALVPLVVMALGPLLHRYSAASRYLALITALSIMVIAPVTTWCVLSQHSPGADQMASSAGGMTGVVRSQGSQAGAGPVSASNASDSTSAEPAGNIESRGTLAAITQWPSFAADAVRPWLDEFVLAWCLGVLIFAQRPILSWFTVRRLRTVGVSAVPGGLQDALERTARRLQVRRAVQLLQSTLVNVPIVVGYLRPVILLPLSVVSGLPAGQLESILAHELAHIRRHDYLVNLLQTVVETVFFYHPLVWWLSRRIRRERENCCDDLAVAALGNRVVYGRALLAIADLRGPQSALALGAHGGSLLDRVQRLFSRVPVEGSMNAGSVFGFALLALAIIAVGVWSSTQADDDGAIPGATVSLDDGIQIELLGVSYQPSEKKPWWKPGGDALQGDPLASRWKYSKSHVADVEGEHRELAFAVTGSKEHVHAWVDFAPGDKLEMWSTFWNFQDDPESENKVTLIRAVSAGFPEEEKQKDILVRLALAPWHPSQVIDLKQDKPQPEIKPEDGTVHLRRVRELRDGSTQVELAYPARFELRSHHEVVGEDINGNEVELHGVTVGDGGARGLIFRCPEDRLAKVRIRFRWYTHEITFRDVSLHPDHLTRVTAKVTKLEPPPERILATLPNGATVEVLGVTYHNWKRNIWWRADGNPLTRYPHDPNLRQVAFTEIHAAARQNECRELAVRISGLPKREELFGYQFGYEPYVDAVHRAVIYEPTEFRAADLAPISTHQVKTVTLRVGMDELPEQVRSFDLDGTKLGEEPADPALRLAEALVQPIRAEEVDGQTQLLLKDVRRGTGPFVLESAPVAIDQDGQRHDSIQAGGRPGFGAYLYPVPRDRIVRFEYSLRLYRHWVTFENISLDPGQKTNVRVKVESLPEAIESQPKRD